MKQFLILTAIVLLVASTTYFSPRLGAKPTPQESIEALQAGALQTKGGYEQLKKGDGRVPAGYRVDVYDGPLGKGYQIFWEDSQGYHSKGYGPEAASRTYSVPKETLVASST